MERCVVVVVGGSMDLGAVFQFQTSSLHKSIMNDLWATSQPTVTILALGIKPQNQLKCLSRFTVFRCSYFRTLTSSETCVL